MTRRQQPATRASHCFALVGVRLVELGARHADVGLGDETWVVLADPEGNKFCVLAPRRG